MSPSLALRPALLPGETPDAVAENGVEAGPADTGVAAQDGGGSAAGLVGIEGVMEGMSLGEGQQSARTGT